MAKMGLYAVRVPLFALGKFVATSRCIPRAKGYTSSDYQTL